MKEVENELVRHSNHLHIAVTLLFPHAKFIESIDTSHEDNSIQLCDDLAVQIGITEQYYVVVQYDRDVDDFKVSHTIFDPAEVFAFIQKIVIGHDPFVKVTNQSNKTMLDAAHFVDAEAMKHPDMTFEDLSIHFEMMSVNVLESKSMLFLEMMWNYIDNHFKSKKI